MTVRGVSAILVTRNRPSLAVQAVRSILRNDYPLLQVVVVDQGDDWTLEGLLGEEPRLLYLRSSRRGLSRGRNEGIAAAAHDLIACTDDDCSVPPDWIRRAEGLLADDRVGLILGNVVPAPHDRRLGVIPGLVWQRESCARTLWDRCYLDGMGACMALRRGAWKACGGFDPALGAGSRFPAGEELDLVLRALQHGYATLESPDFQVIHHGFRPWSQVAGLVRSYWQGTGTVFGKHLRCRRWGVLIVLARMGMRFMRAPSPVAASLGATRSARLQAFVRGLLAGLTSPVDRSRALFLDEP